MKIYQFEWLKISLKICLVCLMIIPTKINSQVKIQKRTILENNHLYTLREYSDSKYLVIFDRNNDLSDFSEIYYSPINTFRVLKNNPIPWYIRGEKFYYVSFDSSFKGNYSLRINVTDYSNIASISDYDLKEIMEIESNPSSTIFLSEMHNRSFNKEDFDNLYYDFTVTAEGGIILISYYKNSICAYKTQINQSKFEFCGCSEENLDQPIQVFEKSNNVFIVDGSNQFIKLIVNDEGDFSFSRTQDQPEIIISENNLIIEND